MILSGAKQLSLDDKGRFAIPIKYRLALGDKEVVLTAYPHGPRRRLVLYPKLAWLAMAERLAGLPPFKKETETFQHLLIGYADHCEVDNAGRVLIAPILRQFATLDKDLMLVGQGNRFELWNLERWREQESVYLQNSATTDWSLPPELEGFLM